MVNCSMPQRSPGTMTRMMPIQFNQHLRRKKVSPPVTFRGRQLTFLFGQVGQRSRPIRSTAGTRLAEAIAAEKLDEYGSSCHRFTLPRDAKAPAKRKRPTTDVSPSDAIQVESDPEDQDFVIPVSEGGSNDDSSHLDSNDVEIANEEVCLFFLFISSS